MARRRPAPVVVRPLSDRRVLVRRFRACAVCRLQADWTVKDIGPLCFDHLTAAGYSPPTE